MQLCGSGSQVSDSLRVPSAIQHQRADDCHCLSDPCDLGECSICLLCAALQLSRRCVHSGLTLQSYQAFNCTQNTCSCSTSTESVIPAKATSAASPGPATAVCHRQQDVQLQGCCKSLACRACGLLCLAAALPPHLLPHAGID
jgi:hypothetical protein